MFLSSSIPGLPRAPELHVRSPGRPALSEPVKVARKRPEAWRHLLFSLLGWCGLGGRWEAKGQRLWPPCWRVCVLSDVGCGQQPLASRLSSGVSLASSSPCGPHPCPHCQAPILLRQAEMVVQTEQVALQEAESPCYLVLSSIFHPGGLLSISRVLSEPLSTERKKGPLAFMG